MIHRYMIIKYIKKPDGKWDEVTEFSSKIKSRHLETAKVILDFKDKKCVVNTLNRDADYDAMLEMYKRLLGDRLTPHLPQESP